MRRTSWTPRRRLRWSSATARRRSNSSSTTAAGGGRPAQYGLLTSYTDRSPGERDTGGVCRCSRWRLECLDARLTFTITAPTTVKPTLLTRE